MGSQGPGRLAAKVVVVTGASAGLGAAVAERVAAEGAAVVLGSGSVAVSLRDRAVSRRLHCRPSTSGTGDDGSWAPAPVAALTGSPRSRRPSVGLPGLGHCGINPSWQTPSRSASFDKLVSQRYATAAAGAAWWAAS